MNKLSNGKREMMERMQCKKNRGKQGIQGHVREDKKRDVALITVMKNRHLRFSICIKRATSTNVLDILVAFLANIRGRGHMVWNAHGFSRRSRDSKSFILLPTTISLRFCRLLTSFGVRSDASKCESELTLQLPLRMKLFRRPMKLFPVSFEGAANLLSGHVQASKVIVACVFRTVPKIK